MLSELHLRDVGPAPAMDVEFAERLNIFTGDNGLGKTFLLDICWWALTNTWAGWPASPTRKKGSKPQISYHAIGKSGPTKKPSIVPFDFPRQEWIRPKGRPTMPGLVIYAKIDGGFSVWDPARNYWKDQTSEDEDQPDRPRAFHFSSETLWDGVEDGRRVVSNGLIRDWVTWQLSDKGSDPSSPFQLMRGVLKSLSSPDEPIEPGPPARVSVDEARDIPTIRLPYGDVPITYASAGMRRVVALSYLLVWAWQEHLRAAELRNEPPTNRLVLLMDEVESHLHPRWQRAIAPSILNVATLLNQDFQTQLIFTTHSPLVLASIEPDFDVDRDRLFLFNINGTHVKLHEVPWAKQGDASNWLISDVFGLGQARSLEAERAIGAAQDFMSGRNDRLPTGLKTKGTIHKELLRVLPDHDRFWPRWIVTAYEKKS